MVMEAEKAGKMKDYGFHSVNHALNYEGTTGSGHTGSKEAVAKVPPELSAWNDLPVSETKKLTFEIDTFRQYSRNTAFTESPSLIQTKLSAKKQMLT
jgi:hypothetical protein